MRLGLESQCVVSIHYLLCGLAGHREHSVCGGSRLQMIFVTLYMRLTQWESTSNGAVHPGAAIIGARGHCGIPRRLEIIQHCGVLRAPFFVSLRR